MASHGDATTAERVPTTQYTPFAPLGQLGLFHYWGLLRIRSTLYFNGRVEWPEDTQPRSDDHGDRDRGRATRGDRRPERGPPGLQDGAVRLAVRPGAAPRGARHQAGRDPGEA